MTKEEQELLIETARIALETLRTVESIWQVIREMSRDYVLSNYNREERINELEKLLKLRENEDS